jgi:hypothetical protein
MAHNLYYNEQGHLSWKVNFKPIHDSFRQLIGFEYNTHGSRFYTNHLCVMVGELSHHWDRDSFNTIFPKYNIDEISVIIGASKFFI